MNKEIRKQRIEELKRKNLKKQLEEKFKCVCTSITDFEFLTSKEIELRFQNVYSNDQNPQIRFKHNLNRIMKEMSFLQKKFSEYRNEYILLYQKEILPSYRLKLRFEDFWNNLNLIAEFLNFEDESSHFFFTLLGHRKNFGIFIYEDEYGLDHILFWDKNL
ncbi:YxiF family protein [Priestia megaterium]|uniref:YxiF family protein n=1 Tax=Priestia megaterium TaxID=1404 RepID=UPI0035DF816F